MAKVNFFQEAEGEYSATRLVFIIGSFYSMGMAAWIFASTKDAITAVGFLTASFTVFGIQKHAGKMEETKQSQQQSGV